MPETGSAAKRVTGVVFDLDGVIVDTEHLWEESWTDCSRDYGHTWRRKDTLRLQGMSPREWSTQLAEIVGKPDAAGAVYERCVGYVVDAIDNGRGPLLPGARDLVMAAYDGAPIALASSAARPVIDTVLRDHELTELFAATVSSDEVERGKPFPDVYAEAARRIGVRTSDDAYGIAFEDSGNGIRAAAAADLTVIAIPNPMYPPAVDALALAGHVAADHADALGTLKELLGTNPDRRTG